MLVKQNSSQLLKDGTCPTCTQLRRQLKALRLRNLRLVQRAQRSEALLARVRDEVRKSVQPPSLPPPVSNSSFPPSVSPMAARKPLPKKPPNRKPVG